MQSATPQPLLGHRAKLLSNPLQDKLSSHIGPVPAPYTVGDIKALATPLKNRNMQFYIKSIFLGLGLFIYQVHSQRHDNIICTIACLNRQTDKVLWYLRKTETV